MHQVLMVEEVFYLTVVESQVDNLLSLEVLEVLMRELEVLVVAVERAVGTMFAVAAVAATVAVAVPIIMVVYVAPLVAVAVRLMEEPIVLI